MRRFDINIMKSALKFCINGNSGIGATFMTNNET